jgi:hypothetical protein
MFQLYYVANMLDSGKIWASNFSLQFNLVVCCTHAVAQCLYLKNEFICFQNTPRVSSHLHIPKIPNRYSKLQSSLLLTSNKNLACPILFLFPFFSFLSSQSFSCPRSIRANFYCLSIIHYK